MPSWASDRRGAAKLINARSETAARKPAFARLIATAARRGLLPADGFYEWLRPEQPRGPRVPFRFTQPDGAPFAFAGLWTPAKIDGEWIATATILTTAANATVAPLHDRMPVILPDRDAELAWLSPELDAAGALALCGPLAPERLVATPANPAVNRAGIPEGPQLLDVPA